MRIHKRFVIKCLLAKTRNSQVFTQPFKELKNVMILFTLF